MTRNDFLIWLAGSDWVMASDGGYRLDDNKFLYVRSDTIDFGYCDDEGVFNLSYYYTIEKKNVNILCMVKTQYFILQVKDKLQG